MNLLDYIAEKSSTERPAVIFAIVDEYASDTAYLFSVGSYN